MIRVIHEPDETFDENEHLPEDDHDQTHDQQQQSGNQAGETDQQVALPTEPAKRVSWDDIVQDEAYKAYMQDPSVSEQDKMAYRLSRIPEVAVSTSSATASSEISVTGPSKRKPNQRQRKKARQQENNNSIADKVPPPVVNKPRSEMTADEIAAKQKRKQLYQMMQESRQEQYEKAHQYRDYDNFVEEGYEHTTAEQRDDIAAHYLQCVNAYNRDTYVLDGPEAREIKDQYTLEKTRRGSRGTMVSQWQTEEFRLFRMPQLIRLSDPPELEHREAWMINHECYQDRFHSVEEEAVKGKGNVLHLPGEPTEVPPCYTAQVMKRARDKLRAYKAQTQEELGLKHSKLLHNVELLQAKYGVPLTDALHDNTDHPAGHQYTDWLVSMMGKRGENFRDVAAKQHDLAPSQICSRGLS